MEIEGQQPKAKDSGNSGNPVNSIHEIVDIGCPDDKNGTEQKPWPVPTPIRCGIACSGKKQYNEKELD